MRMLVCAAPANKRRDDRRCVWTARRLRAALSAPPSGASTNNAANERARRRLWARHGASLDKMPFFLFLQNVPSASHFRTPIAFK